MSYKLVYADQWEERQALAQMKIDGNKDPIFKQTEALSISSPPPPVEPPVVEEVVTPVPSEPSPSLSPAGPMLVSPVRDGPQTEKAPWYKAALGDLTNAPN